MNHREYNSLDLFIAVGLSLLAVMPFFQIFHIELGFFILNAGECILLFLLLGFSVMIAIRGAKRRYFLYVVFAALVFASYTLYSILVLGADFSSVATQLRSFLPFFVACAALLCQLRLSRDVLLRWTAYMVALSASAAIAAHFVFPEFIAYAFSASEEVSAIILKGGRMYWGSAALSFFGAAALLLEKDRRQKVRLALAMVVIFCALFFTQNRTLLVGVLIFYIAAQIFVFRKGVQAFLWVGVLLVISATAFVLVSPDGAVELLQRRLFLAGDLGSQFAHSVSGRMFLYDMYIEILSSTFPFGQSLGFPLGVNRAYDQYIYTTDVSFLSFALPFGIFGAWLFIGFIYYIGGAFLRESSYSLESSFSNVFIFMIVVAFLVSLNLDLFSRNAFAIYLAVFAVLPNKRSEINRLRPEKNTGARAWT